MELSESESVIPILMSMERVFSVIMVIVPTYWTGPFVAILGRQERSDERHPSPACARAKPMIVSVRQED